MRGRSILLAAMASLVASVAQVAPTAATVNGVVYFGDRSQHVVALTFDDGYNVTACQSILATLQLERVPATFFPVGRAVQANPAFWRTVDAAGYPIGDHSLTHPEMTRLSPTQQRAELVQSRAIIERVLGHRMTNIFRPPYGDVDATLVASARAAGFPTVVYWDTSDADSSPNGTDALHVAAGSRGRNGSIVLMHCGPAMTPRILPSIIASYRARGFGFVTLPQMLGVRGPHPIFTTPVPARVAPATPTPTASPTARPALHRTPPPSLTERVAVMPGSPSAAQLPADLRLAARRTRPVPMALFGMTAATLVLLAILATLGLLVRRPGEALDPAPHRRSG